MSSETYPIGALASKTIHFNSYSRSSEESTTPIVDRISPIPTKSFDSHLSTSRTVREWLLDSLGIISFVFHYDFFFILFGTIYFDHSINKFFYPFIQLHYSTIRSNEQLYSFGLKDLYTVFFFSVCLTSLRYLLSNTVFIPIAHFFQVYETPEDSSDSQQVSTFHKCIEQEWLVLYYICSFTFGFKLVRYDLQYSLDNAWLNYPHIYVPFEYKLYYLIQLSFYFHQLVVISVEKHRKDYLEMVFHHVIAATLMLLSMYTNFTRIGVVILTTYDITDIFLPLSKMMEYGYQVPIGYIVFGVFALLWFVTRHVWFFFILYSVYARAPELVNCEYSIADGCFNAPKTMHAIFLTILFALQCLQLFWFQIFFRRAICRLIYRKLVLGIELGDNRSEDGDDNSERERTIEELEHADKHIKRD